MAYRQAVLTVRTRYSYTALSILGNLIRDVARMVCEELYRTDEKKALLALTSVSKHWWGVATPWLYRSIDLRFGPTDTIWTARLLRNLMDAEHRMHAYRHYIHFLFIWMPPTKGESSRRRLPSSALTVLVDFVSTLSNLRKFGWEVREPMPDALALALRNCSRLADRTALVTCWGLDEDREHVEKLGHEPIDMLAIEWRPRKNVDNDRLAEIVFYQQRLLLTLPKLKGLAINFAHNRDCGFVELIHMNKDEFLPTVKFLHLEHYRFSRNPGGLQFHLDTRNLQILTLFFCRRFEYFFSPMAETRRPFKFLELAIRSPVWRIDLMPHQKAWLIWFLSSQGSLVVLDLENVGIPVEIVHAIVKNSGRTLKQLRIHDFEDALRTTSVNTTIKQIKCFRSVPAPTLRIIGDYCPRLTILNIDLTQLDIKWNSEALAVLSSLESLQHLQITTLFNTQAIDPYCRQMTTGRALNIAGAVWSQDLRAFRLKVETMEGDESERGDTDSWLVTRCYDTWRLKIVDEVETNAEKKFERWTRALKAPHNPPEDKKRRAKWEKKLEKRVDAAGTKALKALK